LTTGFSALAHIWRHYMWPHKARFFLALVTISVVSGLYALEVYMVRFIFDGMLNPSTDCG